MCTKRAITSLCGAAELTETCIYKFNANEDTISQGFGYEILSFYTFKNILGGRKPCEIVSLRLLLLVHVHINSLYEIHSEKVAGLHNSIVIYGCLDMICECF